MSELSKKMRESRAKASQGEWTFFHGDDESSMNAYGVRCDSPAHKLHGFDESHIGDVDPNTMVCLTLMQSPRVVSHRDYQWEENAEFIADAANETDNLCAEIEALEKENAEMRAELETLRRGPTVDPDPIDEDFEDQLRKCAD